MQSERPEGKCAEVAAGAVSVVSPGGGHRHRVVRGGLGQPRQFLPHLLGQRRGGGKDNPQAADKRLRQSWVGLQAVMAGGEAGVGKSRLVTEFAGRSRGAGMRVLMGGFLELGADGLPFAPITAVLRELVRDLGAAGVAGLLPGCAARELARLLPEFDEPPEPVTQARRGCGCSSRY
jgi:hypothetical protein